MFLQNPSIPTGYVSLENSIVTSPKQIHNRTQSYDKIPPSNPQNLTHTRTPSKKKLSLTCQNMPPLDKSFKKENNGMLKKKGASFPEKRTSFVSMGSSRIAECETVYSKTETQAGRISQIKQMFQDRLRQLELAYSQSLNESANQIRELQRQLLANSRLLQTKQKQINYLEKLCQEYRQKFSICSQKSFHIVNRKLNDAEIKIRILSSYLEDSKKEENGRIEKLTEQVLAHFGNKFENMKEKSLLFVQHSIKKMAELSNELECIKNKNEKHHTERTRISMQSVGSELEIGYRVSQPEQIGTSFYDDCFFYPTDQVQTSQDYELIVQMAKSRDQPLSCQIDREGNIRYTDTNSVKFNRSGHPVKLSQQQWFQKSQ